MEPLHSCADGRRMIPPFILLIKLLSTNILFILLFNWQSKPIGRKRRKRKSTPRELLLFSNSFILKVWVKQGLFQFSNISLMSWCFFFFDLPFWLFQTLRKSEPKPITKTNLHHGVLRKTDQNSTETWQEGWTTVGRYKKSTNVVGYYQMEQLVNWIDF